MSAPIMTLNAVEKFIFVQALDAINQRLGAIPLQSVANHEFQNVVQHAILDAAVVAFIMFLGVAVYHFLRVAALLHKAC